MEHSNFDDIIKQKISEQHALHQDKMQSAKPFVWAKVLSNTQKKGIVVPWYYAAAAILFLFCSTFFFLQSRYNQLSEIRQLSNQLNQLSNITVPEILTLKNKQIDLICEEMETLEQSYKQHYKKPSPIQKQFVYLTDTVYLSKVEYITEYIPLSIEKKDSTEQAQPMLSKVDVGQSSNLIYPDSYSSSKSNSTENPSIKLKLNTLTIN